MGINVHIFLQGNPQSGSVSLGFKEENDVNCLFDFNSNGSRIGSLEFCYRERLEKTGRNCHGNYPPVVTFIIDKIRVIYEEVFINNHY